MARTRGTPGRPVPDRAATARPGPGPGGDPGPPGERSGGSAAAGDGPSGDGAGVAEPPGRGGVLGWALVALVALLALGLALVECFLVPLRVGTVPMPVSVPLALAGNVVLARLSAALSGLPLTAVIPPVLWLGVVLGLSVQRPEGDLVVPGTLTGLVFLLGGSIAGAYGAASSITRSTRPHRPTRG